MIKLIRHVCVNDRGLRIGESHPRAKLSDHQIEEIRTLAIEHRVPYRELAKRFSISFGYVWKIVSFKRRNKLPAEYR